MTRRDPARRAVAWLTLALSFASGLGFAPRAPGNHPAVAGHAFAFIEHELEKRDSSSSLHPVNFAHAIARHSNHRPHRWRARAPDELALVAGRPFRVGGAETWAPMLAANRHESGFRFALMSGAALEAALARLRS